MRKIYRERHARYMSMSRDSPWDSVLSVSCSQKRKRQHEHRAQSAQEAKPTKSQTTSTNWMQRTTRNCDREGKREGETLQERAVMHWEIPYGIHCENNYIVLFVIQTCCEDLLKCLVFSYLYSLQICQISTIVYYTDTYNTIIKSYIWIYLLISLMKAVLS